MKTPRVIAVHMLNDFSSSPFIFSQALNALQQQGFEVHLFTTTPSGRGFLNEIWNIFIHPLFYRTSNNKWLNGCWLLCHQMVLFFQVFLFTHSDDIVYINSMFPFGAALAARLKGCKVLYHIQEISVRPLFLKKWLMFVINRTASCCFYLSEYARQYTNSKVSGMVVRNVLPSSFIEKVTNNREINKQPFTVLMLCSLKRCKGLNEFVKCAIRLPEMRFELVLNAPRVSIDNFFTDVSLPANLYIHSAQSNVHSFYSRASIVVNLSQANEWIEPFGMTALEAMYYRKPVIVPCVGGIAELVDDHVNGFCVDTGDIHAVVEKMALMATDRSLYMRMSDAAFAKAAGFTQRKFRQSIIQAIHAIMVQKDRRARICSINMDPAIPPTDEEKGNKIYRNQPYYSPLARLWKVGRENI